MVISNDDFEVALGEYLSKAGDDSIKTVLGNFDKQKTVTQNVTKLKNSSGTDLQNTIAFLKNNSPEYPVAQLVLSCKNRNKEEYSKDIAKFLDFVKPTHCLSCSENFIPAAEQCEPNHPKCYLCQRPSHSKCYAETVIKPELGLILVCSECISIKAAKDLAIEINTKKPEDIATEPDSRPATEQPQGTPTEHPQATPNQTEEDCPLYLKRQCPYGVTGKKELNGNICPYKHRRRCKYYMAHGPTGCRFGSKCRFLHPPLCQNSLLLKTCLNNSNCQQWHIEGTKREVTQRNNRNQAASPQAAITTSNRFPPWMAESSQAWMAESSQDEAPSNHKRDARSRTIHPWENNPQSPIENQSSPINRHNNSRGDFLERRLEGRLEEMQANLMNFIRTSITEARAAQSSQPQYIMMQPSNFSQPIQPQQVPAENWATNVQTAPQLECPQANTHQAANYQTQYSNVQQAPQTTFHS